MLSPEGIAVLQTSNLDGHFAVQYEQREMTFHDKALLKEKVKLLILMSRKWHNNVLTGNIHQIGNVIS